MRLYEIKICGSEGQWVNYLLVANSDEEAFRHCKENKDFSGWNFLSSITEEEKAILQKLNIDVRF